MGGFERGDLVQWSLDRDFKSDSSGAELHSLLHREVSSGLLLDDPMVYDVGRLLDLFNPKRFCRNDYEMSAASSESNLKQIKIAGCYSYPVFLLDGRSFSGTIRINGTDGADSTGVGVEEVLERIKIIGL